MKNLCSMLLGLLIVATAGAAQEPIITPNTRVDTATLHQWLHSGDPRLIAWAADFARRKHDMAVIAEMPDWVEHWPMPPFPGEVTWPSVQRRALVARPVLAVLDALIQENASVPISTINAVASAFPAQAAVLIIRHSLSESRYVLDGWMDAGDPALVRIANMMFVKKPDMCSTSSRFYLSFVGGVVADSESELWITVGSTAAEHPFGAGGGTACGDSEGRSVEPGWPQIYTYELVENDAGANGPPMIDVGGDRIATMRYPENEGWGTCYYVQPLDAYTRHRLIAYWLGVKPEEMTWQPVEAFTIHWTDKPAYDRELAKIIDSQRQKLRATSDALRQRGILTGLDAVPKLVVDIQCTMKPCPLQ